MNILLIAIDTLSARHVGCYGYHRDTTPFLDEFARDSVLFESLYCQAIPTTPSYTSLYTGQYAATHGIVAHGPSPRRLSRQAPMLAESLQEHGYTTCAIDSLANKGNPKRDWFRRGYEFYIEPHYTGKYFQACPWEPYNAQAIPWLKTHSDEQFFLFVHYWDPHAPYAPPPEYRDLFYKGDPCDPSIESLAGLWKHPFAEPWKGWFDQLMPGITDAEYIAAMYDSEIRYVDDGMRQLVGTLDKLGLADDTLVIVLSDHGEMMYRHGIWFDHHGLYDQDIHVPLIIRCPGMSHEGRRIPHLVQHIDIAPTVLDLAGIAVPEEMEGTSLKPYLTGEADEPIYPFLVTEECTRMMKWAIRTDRYKYILAREQDYLGGPMRELYNLEADPNEMHNLAEEEPELSKQLEDVLEDWIAKMMQKNGITEDPLVSHGCLLGAEWTKWVEEQGYW